MKHEFFFILLDGGTVKRIQNMTGTRCEIDCSEIEYDEGNKILMIRGNAEQIAHAKTIFKEEMESLVNENSEIDLLVKKFESNLKITPQ